MSVERVRIGGVEDAARLRRAGYTTRAIHARWVLEAFAALSTHLADEGEPLADTGDFDTSHYLTPDEWRDVRSAAEMIVILAPAIAQGLEWEKGDDA